MKNSNPKDEDKILAYPTVCQDCKKEKCAWLQYKNQLLCYNCYCKEFLKERGRVKDPWLGKNCNLPLED